MLRKQQLLRQICLSGDHRMSVESTWKLRQQLLTLQGIQHEYQVSLETMRASSSWRLTAPLRRLLNLVRGH